MNLSEKVALVVSVREEYSLTAALSALEIPTAFGMLERCAWKQARTVLWGGKACEGLPIPTRFLRNWLLSGCWHKNSLLGHEIEAKFGGLALEVNQFPLPLLGFITFSPDVFKGYFVLEHKVDGTSDLVSGGHQGLSGTQLGPFTSVKGPEGGVGAGHRSRCLAEGLTGSVVGFESTRA